MKKLYKEKKQFNRAYIPVIVSSILLIALIAGLVLVILYKPNSDNEDTNSSSNDSSSNTEFSVSSDDLNISSSDSTCSSDEQKTILSESSKISVSIEKTMVQSEEESYNTAEASEYENVEDIPKYYVNYDAYKIKFSNITSNIYIVVTNDSDDSSAIYTFDDLEDGVASLTTTNIYDVITYTVSVYSNNDNCKDEVYRQFTFKTPEFNILADSNMCKDNDTDECDTYIYEAYDYTELFDNYLNSNAAYEDNNYYSEESETTKSNNYYLIYIIIGFVCLVMFVIIIIIVIARKKHKKVN